MEKLQFEQKKFIIQKLPLLLPVLEHNPRRLKRLLNEIQLNFSVNQNRGQSISFEQLLNWTIIEYVFPSLAAIVKSRPRYLLLIKSALDKLCLQTKKTIVPDL